MLCVVWWYGAMWSCVLLGDVAPCPDAWAYGMLWEMTWDGGMLFLGRSDWCVLQWPALTLCQVVSPDDIVQSGFLELLSVSGGDGCLWL